MLNKPEFGWCNIVVNETYIGTASYMTDPAIDCLQAFIDRLSVAEEKPKRFSVEFDAEGWAFGLIEFDGEVFFINDKETDGKAEITHMGYSWELLPILAKECISDIRKYMDKWIVWYGEDETDKHLRRALLMEKLDTLEAVLKARERI